MMLYLRLLCAVLILICAQISRADDLSALNSEMIKWLREISKDESSWNQFLETSKVLPKLNDKTPDSFVRVEKEEIKANGDTYVVGTSYRFAAVKAPKNKVLELLTSPEKFQSIYELDKPVAAALVRKTKNYTDSFDGYIYKKLPSILPDQEYSLRYTAKVSGKTWIQDIELSKDPSDFALRHTILVVREGEGALAGKTLVWEIARLYPKGWGMRQMGPTLRAVTKSELEKMNAKLHSLF